VSCIVEVAPIDGRVLITAELTLLLSLLERVLGGQPGDRPAERSLTEVDRALIASLFQMVLDELSISLGDVAELQFGMVELETERAPAQLAPLSEPTLAITFEFKLGRASSTMVLLIPHRAIEPVLKVTPATQQETDLAAGAVAAIGEAMHDVVMQLRAEVGSVELSLAGVLALRPGDILRLDGAAEEGAVTLYADTIPLHRAKLGRSGRRRAVGVLGPVEDEA
jgi:flagellar motor switch protein FliM